MRIKATVGPNGKVKRETFIDGPIYASGPLILQGTDVKAELEKNKKSIEELIQKCDDIEAYLQYIFDNFQLKPDEQTLVQKALDMVKGGAEISGIISLILAGLSPANIAIAAFVLTHNIYKSIRK